MRISLLIVIPILVEFNNCSQRSPSDSYNTIEHLDAINLIYVNHIKSYDAKIKKKISFCINEIYCH